MNKLARDVLTRQAEADLESHLRNTIELAPGHAELLTRQYQSECEEFTIRLLADREALDRQFARTGTLGQVATLRAGLSDRHRGGRTVFQVTFASGRLLIYKPRDGRTDAAFYAFLEWLGHAIDAPRPLASVARPTHGWFEYIEPTPATPGSGSQRYWQRLGVLICVADVLGGNDFHRANLVDAGDTPILVDAEALFCRYIGRKKPDPGGDALDVLGTGLTPYWKEKRTGRIDASGAGCPPAMHIDDVITGYETAYCALLEQRQTLLAADGPVAAFGELEVRCLHRDTASYLEVLRDALAGEELNQDWLLSRLRPDSDSARLQPVIEAEAKALLRLDVPRFTALGGSTSLDLDGSGTANEWFSETGVDRAMRRIESMTAEDMARRSDALRSIYALASIEACLR